MIIYLWFSLLSSHLFNSIQLLIDEGQYRNRK